MDSSFDGSRIESFFFKYKIVCLICKIFLNLAQFTIRTKKLSLLGDKFVIFTYLSLTLIASNLIFLIKAELTEEFTNKKKAYWNYTEIRCGTKEND